MRSKDPVQTLLDLQNHSNSQPAWTSREMLWLFAAVFVVAALLFIWAIYIRKPKRENSGKELVSTSSEKSSRRRRRAKRSRRRNPTLAETGGLPPRKHDSIVPHSR